MTRITLLTKTDCDLCEQAKQTLKRLCDELGDVTVELVDINSAVGRQLAQEAGMVFPPGVILEGQAFSYGRLSERKLRRALAGRRPVNAEGDAGAHRQLSGPGSV